MKRHVITLPNGRQCSIGVYAHAWSHLLTLPPQEPVKGWDWFSSTAADVLRQMRHGLMDRINRHDRTHIHSSNLGSRIFKKMQAAALRGAIRFDCRWCGTQLERNVYLQEHARFCDQSCSRSYYS